MEKHSCSWRESQYHKDDNSFQIDQQNQYKLYIPASYFLEINKLIKKIYMEMQITQKSQNYLITKRSITISNLNTKLLYQNSTGMV